MVLTQPEQREKLIRKSIVFPYHYGSHATGYKLIGKDPINQFPYHYGSHATIIYAGAFQLLGEAFPYHYGSHATFKRLKTVADAGSFPYHYGSHATSDNQGPTEPHIQNVSIPLWFSRNLARRPLHKSRG